MIRKTGLAVALWAAFGLAAAGAAGAADFFKDKNIRVIVGYAPGGGYDAYTRQVVRHMSKHVPGNPSFIVQNMTGAGSLVAANYTQRKAKRDGTVLGVWNSGFVLTRALGDSKAQIKPKELGWIGAPVKGNPSCVFMTWSGVKSLAELIDPDRKVKVGGTRTGSTGVDMPKILNRTMGTNFEVISGYSGTAKTRLAMQSKEVAGACWGWESIRSTARAMLDAEGDGKLIPLLVTSRAGDPELKDALVVPELVEKRGGKTGLATYSAWGGQYEFQRPFVAPPGVPADRLAALRAGFMKTMSDPEFLAEAEKANLTIQYVSPQEIAKHVDTIMDMPQESKDALSFLVRKTN